MKDIYDLNRFIEIHNEVYPIALEEIRNGSKKSHWMWYIFPQLADLGYSSTAKYYGIKTKEEALAYLNNEILRSHLIEISEAIYQLNDDISNILGYPDDIKLKSSMTLFKLIDPNIEIFQKIIDKFYNGEEDITTIKALSKINE